MTCAVNGCARETRSPKAKLCNTHYFRLWRTGKIGEAKIWDKKRHKCRVKRCLRLANVRGHCLLHDRRIQKGGHPDYTPSRAWDKNPAWRGDAVGYVAAHERVYARHGVASKKKCKCGKQAKHWAYTHADPKELCTPNGIPYSADPAFYVALCVSCHKTSDLQRRR